MDLSMKHASDYPMSRKRRLLEYLGEQEEFQLKLINKENENLGLQYIQVIPSQSEIIAKKLYMGTMKEQPACVPLNETPLNRTENKPTDELQMYSDRIAKIIATANDIEKRMFDLTQLGVVIREYTEDHDDHREEIKMEVPDSPPSTSSRAHSTQWTPIKKFIQTTAVSAKPPFINPTPIPAVEQFYLISDQVMIGPNGTFMSKAAYAAIDWELSATVITRKLAVEIFGLETLSTHSLSGKPSPAFLDIPRPKKKALDPTKVADIVYLITSKKDVIPKEVRLAITSKCADVQKMCRIRNERQAKANQIDMVN